MKPRSKRDTALLMNRAHRDMGLLYDKLPMLTQEVSPPRRQRERGSNPDAAPSEHDEHHRATMVHDNGMDSKEKAAARQQSLPGLRQEREAEQDKPVVPVVRKSSP